MTGGPLLCLDTGNLVPLPEGVTTVGRSPAMGVRLTDPTVSPLHAELVRRGPYVYVEDLGLSCNGTQVNGRPAERMVLSDGDRIWFGAASCAFSGGDVPAESGTPVPELTARQLDVLMVLCIPQTDGVFRVPRSVHAMSRVLGVAEPTIRTHLERIARRLCVRRHRDDPLTLMAIANAAVRLGLVPDVRRPRPEEGLP
jgi:hypothetical protein